MTWSILVRDPATGEVGGAVASRFFAVGSLCLHVEGGVGALATQALINPMYAYGALPRLRAGGAPEVILGDLTVPDAGGAHRQCHILDATGRMAQYTGASCIGWAGHVSGDNVSVAGNMLAGPEVVERTLAAWQASTGPMADRLLTAMEAGEAAGGDKRGRQAAALKICSRDPYPDLDIRADDHADPLAELRRLVAVSAERFAVFRRFMPGLDHPAGTTDRQVIEAAIAEAAQRRS
jgi:uncharacterized Ntn-hydrolase superfamily protein